MNLDSQGDGIDCSSQNGEMEAKMIHTTIRMMMPPGKRNEALGILNVVAERAGVEPGCFFNRVYQDVKDENILMVEELWNSEEELNRHLCSDDYRNVLCLMELSIEPPEFNFRSIAKTIGLEAIEKARNFGR